MYPRSLSSILARATLWCLKAAPSFELVVSRAPYILYVLQALSQRLERVGRASFYRRR